MQTPIYFIFLQTVLYELPISSTHTILITEVKSAVIWKTAANLERNQKNLHWFIVEPTVKKEHYDYLRITYM